MTPPGALLTACRTAEVSRANGDSRETDTPMKARTCRHHGLVTNHARAGPEGRFGTPCDLFPSILK